MDRKLPEPPEIQRLIRLSAAARSCLARDATALRQKLDIPSRIRDSLHTHPAAWWLGSLASGVAASFLVRRKPKTGKKISRGIPSVLLGFAWTAARPIMKTWLLGQLKNWLAGQAFPPTPGRLNSRSPLTFKSL